MLKVGDIIGRYTVLGRIGSTVNGEPLYELTCNICSKDKELYADNFKGTEYNLNKGKLVCGCSKNYFKSQRQLELLIHRKDIATFEYLETDPKINSKTKVLAKCKKCGHTWQTTLGFLTYKDNGCHSCKTKENGLKMKGKIGKRKLIHGVGVNDSEVPVESSSRNSEGKLINIYRCPFYNRWLAMLERCYSKTFKLKFPTYMDVTCCEEWLLFSNFKSWMEQQDWEGKHLDKDLLVYQNKVYSPETCVFIPQELNSFLVRNDVNRGELPLGVTLCSLIHGIYQPSKKYAAYCGHSLTKNGKRTSCVLGRFYTKEDAHRAWQQEKMRLVLMHIDNTNCELTQKGLRRVYTKIKHDFDNNLITEDF